MTVGLDLDQYQLKKRVLLVFAPNPDDARYEEQQAHLKEDEEALRDRDVVIFGIFENGPSYAEDRPLSTDDSARARQEFDVEEAAFGLRLLDLDGTEIATSPEPLPVPALVDVIDGKME
ncbi:MAG: DUF4174 domain-containing protein [Gemmatimonadetes bacterium]|nr:DUF4174 domain-containing protein [Gemmatimonadota bacterium]NIR81347.1 DUF4174 domain-containing protein [Gemmatimonadota bacterium]NIT90180.1 DUF4174 domain-containing protein [Gemmatimonadota bacterium]NIU34007.1 DUF4174 domain-containing protein [Gemmatimonadota bacterium]NIU38172.1 DUF4174 domain-containing protein [Gemmatimonadota bacterium]